MRTSISRSSSRDSDRRPPATCPLSLRDHQPLTTKPVTGSTSPSPRRCPAARPTRCRRLRQNLTSSSRSRKSERDQANPAERQPWRSVSRHRVRQRLRVLASSVPKQRSHRSGRGRCALPEPDRRHGGPFSANSVHLIYLNRTADFPFRKELEHWQKQLPAVSIDYVLTQGMKSKERRRLLRESVDNSVRYYHIAGPSAMIEPTESRAQERRRRPRRHPDRHVRRLLAIPLMHSENDQGLR